MTDTKDLTMTTHPATAAAELIYSPLGADEDLAPLVELFVAELPERLSLMNESWQRHDWELFRRTAHQLKGAAGSYGFHALTPHLIRLYKALGDETAETEIRDSLEAVRDVCSRVRAGSAER
jgi:HPt (histidine-containing phosphotransfer) domain-containing protein